MKLCLAIFAAAMVGAAPAMAQTTFNVGPNTGGGFVVQGSDGSIYNYSVGEDGSYTVQKSGADGFYYADPPTENGYTIQGHGDPKWSLPTIVPPPRQ